MAREEPNWGSHKMFLDACISLNYYGGVNANFRTDWIK